MVERNSFQQESNPGAVDCKAATLTTTMAEMNINLSHARLHLRPDHGLLYVELQGGDLVITVFARPRWAQAVGRHRQLTRFLKHQIKKLDPKINANQVIYPT